MQEAEEERIRKEQNNKRFTQGKSAYSTGQYAASEVLFKEALESEGDLSPLGGEIQLWLALSYQVGLSCQIQGFEAQPTSAWSLVACVVPQACGKQLECIEMYKSIEKNHPLPKVKRQAAELRYIMEAPRLKVGPDERVKLPILEDQSRYV